MRIAGAVRELIESVAIAFILAFMFRTFEAEAFVIPTGSMAPTLMGRHKDVICRKCKYPYRVSASEEVMPDGTLRDAIQSHGKPYAEKVMIVDELYTLVGSANLDPRSLYINLEFLAVIRSAEMARLMLVSSSRFKKRFNGRAP